MLIHFFFLLWETEREFFQAQVFHYGMLNLGNSFHHFENKESEKETIVCVCAVEIG